MSKKLYPELDPNIVEAIENGNLIIFIGAGISALYGYPVWDELARRLLNQCEKEKKITKSQKEVLLSNSFNAMQRVTIACGKFDDEKQGIEQVKRILSEEPTNEEEIKKKHEKIEKIAKYLSKYRCPIITTNADLSLDQSKPFSKGLILDSFKNWNHNYDDLSLIHLHGSINEPENMIFTSQAYAKAYRAEDKEFGEKLIKLLRENKTILFMGYGMNEFELIKYFISDISEIPNRFVLKGYLDKDRLVREFDEEYYQTLGITLIPYSMEKEGYDALIKVLGKWDKTISKETMVHKRLKQIVKDICSQEPNEENIKKLEGLLNE